MGCTEGQPQEKEEQTKKGPRFSEKSTRGTSQQGYYMQMSPSSTDWLATGAGAGASALVSPIHANQLRSPGLCELQKGQQMCARVPRPLKAQGLSG